jgi:ATP-binding cassette subfamily C (CFTR/MRP) protein 10
MMAAFIVSFISIMAVVGHAHPESHIAAATAGLVGLGLSYSTPIIGLLSDLMTSFAETEKEMVSVERVQQYMGVEAEADEGREQVGQQWPTQGSVEFSHVTLLYLPWLPPALIDLSFSINPGEHVKSMHLNPKP